MSDNRPHDAVVHNPRDLPAMLPGKLIGRETELTKVYAPLKAGGAVLVHGVPGVGKTALAATLASAYAQQSGGVLWLNVQAPTLEELIVRVGRAFSVPEITDNSNPISMIGAAENTLKQHKPFIVIDGTIDADVLSRFISRCTGGLPLLVVNPAPLAGDWETVGLEKLTPEQAAALYKREGRVAANEHDITVYGIIKQIDALPFSVIVAARAMIASKQTPDQFLAVLRQISDATDTSGPNAALSASFRALKGPLQGLVLMMGAMFDGGASAALLSRVSNAPVESVEQAMTILAQLGLVERTTRHGIFHYTMHQLTQSFALAYLQGADKLDGLRQKVREAVIGFADAIDADEADFNRLAAHLPTFMAAARWAAEHEDREVASSIVTALRGAGNFVSERGFLYELNQLKVLSKDTSAPFPAYDKPDPGMLPPLDLDDDEDEDFDDDLLLDDDDEYDSEYLVDRDALEPVDDDEDEAAFVDPVPSADPFAPPPMPQAPRAADPFAPPPMPQPAADDPFALPATPTAPDDGEVPTMLSDAAPAEDLSSADVETLRGLLAQARGQSDRARQLMLLKAIGRRQINEGRSNEAIATYNEILTVYESMRDEAGILETLDMLSALMVRTDNAQAAVTHATHGVQLARDRSDRVTLLQLYITLGDAHQLLGEGGQAIKDYGEALAIARTGDDTQHEAIVLYKLGYAQLDDGDAETAIHTFEQARNLFKKQGKRAYEGKVMGGLGSAHGDRGSWSEAMRFHTSAMYIARETHDREEEAMQLASLAYAAQQAGQLGEAVLRYRQALHLAFEADDREDIVSTIVDLGRLLLQSDKYASIAQMLLDTAATYEPGDRDVQQLQGRVADVMTQAEADGKALKPVKGDARTYAANAYSLMDS